MREREALSDCARLFARTLLQVPTHSAIRPTQGEAIQLTEELLAGTSDREGYTWCRNRHTFASRFVVAGADLRSYKHGEVAEPG